MHEVINRVRKRSANSSERPESHRQVYESLTSLMMSRSTDNSPLQGALVLIFAVLLLPSLDVFSELFKKRRLKWPPSNRRRYDDARFAAR
jgi:hypothetical protein